MKDIVKNIIDNYFKANDFKYELSLDDTLLVIKDVQGSELDFFYFVYNKSIKDDIEIKNIFNELIQRDKKLKEIESFDKNLNFIFFIKIDDYKNKNKYTKIAYEIEQYPLYAKNKVIFYDENIANSFDNYNLDITKIDKIEEKIDIKDKFILDLVIGLSFIKVNFGSKQNHVENNIFQDSFDLVNEEYNIIGTKVKLLDNYEEFNDKIIKLNNYDDLLGDITDLNKGITNFEKELLGLFGEGKIDLENSLLKYSIKNDEDEIKELLGL